MNILEIAKRVGSGLFREIVPGGGLILEAVNQFLPEDKKIPLDASGRQIEGAISSLPPEFQAQVMLKQFDVDIKQIEERINSTTQANDTLRVMLAQDAVTPHTTRPRIALGCFWVLALSTAGIITPWMYGVFVGNSDMVSMVMDGWPFVASITGPFVTLLWAYFGILKQENRDKLDAANNLPTRAGGLLSILKR